MATLPDLDTSTTSFVAYWNALDHGVNDISPDDVLSDGSIQSYTLYDNGVTVQYQGVTGRTFTVRVKEDGWFVAYFDRTQTANQQTTDPPRGRWDLINDWTDPTSEGQITQNTLERAINSLQSQLGNAGSITYASADVELYDYEFTSATTVTQLAWQQTRQDDTTDSGVSYSPRFLYSSSTTILMAWAVGAVSTGSGNSNYHSNTSWSDGTTIAAVGNGDPDEYGSIELLSAGRIPNAETNYGHDVNLGTPQNNGTSHAHVNTLLLWS